MRQRGRPLTARSVFLGSRRRIALLTIHSGVDFHASISGISLKPPPYPEWYRIFSSLARGEAREIDHTTDIQLLGGHPPLPRQGAADTRR